MREKRIDLVGGIVERRFYDENDKLVEIRKEYPPKTPVRRVGNFKRNVKTLVTWHDLE